jgi:ApaG protein
MNEAEKYLIDVQVQTRYLEDQSQPDAGKYAFAYTITLVNRGTVAAQLISRHWIITDGNGSEQEVRGLGVIGEQPHLAPGDTHRYTSGSLLPTPVGTMRGSYQMMADDGTRFDTPIPSFTLAVPTALH